MPKKAYYKNRNIYIIDIIKNITKKGQWQTTRRTFSDFSFRFDKRIFDLRDKFRNDHRPLLCGMYERTVYYGKKKKSPLKLSLFFLFCVLNNEC